VSEPIKRSAKVDQKEYLKRMQKEMSKRKEEYKRRDSVDAEKLYKGRSVFSLFISESF
jgi:hypothetical protein